MLGLLEWCQEKVFYSGITPACAGTTLGAGEKLEVLEDHPCMCWDYNKGVDNMVKIMGSPLHVRGLHIYSFLSIFCLRITPACAGTTLLYIILYLVIGDHPRLCEDYYLSSSLALMVEGSPPHVRGLRPKKDTSSRVLRITPACAGTTVLSCPRHRLHQDHPRLCGDYVDQGKASISSRGSPPPVRGLLKSHIVTLKVGRITPACAGTTF